MLSDPVDESFAAVEVPGAGWRLTITPAGLRRCGRIVVVVAGFGKAEALKEVFHGPQDPIGRPVQFLQELVSNTVWLLDEDASGLL